MTRALASRLALLPVLAAVALPATAAEARAATPKLSLCTPVPIKTTHGAKAVEAYCRLARIRNGTVPCSPVGSLKHATCTFNRASGIWIEATTGAAYALAGQRISRAGKPGGGYLITSELARNGRPPCAAPRRPRSLTARAADSIGVVGTTEMAGACTIQVNQSATNAYGFKLENHATREVCTSSYPHPDGARLVRRPRAGVYCYTGTGAALNDRSGRERGPDNRYLAGPEHCHVLWTAPPEQGGREVFASKRPNVSPYPAPGHVVDTSPIIWRPYTGLVAVAN
ncbi:MAG TPA: hypothetical protein VD931_15605 [Baekduia sp.]|nr:hypothetical protein [Baekduia sp.]